MKKTIIVLLAIVLLGITIAQNTTYAINPTDNFQGTFVGDDVALSAEIKNTTSTNIAPSITFLVHGLQGNAAHWSNTLGDNLGISGNPESGSFSYNPNSIVEILRRRTQGTVYEVRADTDASSFQLYLTEISGTSYTSTLQTSITSVNSHIIVVYQAYSGLNDKTHQELYNHLEIVINRISYDVRESLNAEEIRVNLIGHSRGGLINMLYASEYPYNVDGLFSVGTPYNGTALGSLISLIPGLAGSGSGYQQILDTTSDVQDNYVKSQWINMQNNHQDVNINFHAIGVSSGLSYIMNIISSIYSDPNYAAYQDQISLVYGVLVFYEKQFYGNDDFFEEINLDREDYEVYSYLIPAIIVGYLDNYVDELDDEQITAISNLLYSIYFSYKVDELILRNDLMVDTDSQLAIGFDDVDEENKIPINNFEKILTWKNTNIKNRASTEPGIAHNLETRDLDIINYIMQNISFNGYDSQLNTIYLENNKLGALSRPISYQNASITFPTTIYGISKYFSDYTSNTVTNIEFGSNIELIEDGALNNFDNLQSFTVSQQNIYFRTDNSYALYSYDKKILIKFANGANTSNYTVYDETLTISQNAFKNNQYLTNVNLKDTTMLRENAFYNATNLQTITANSMLRIFELALHKTNWHNNSNNTTLGYTLVRYSGNEATVNLDSYTSIYSYAFYNKNNIEKIVLDSYSSSVNLYVAKYAFLHMNNLKYIFLMDDKTQFFSELSILDTHSSLSVYYIPGKISGNGFYIRNDVKNFKTEIQILLQTNGGTVNAFDYTPDMTDQLIVLPVPLKSGATFTGWYMNSGLTGASVSQGYAWQLHDIQLYAKYIATITYEQSSQTQHKVINHATGSVLYRPHMVDIGYDNPRWVNCILCGQLIDLWYTPVIPTPFGLNDNISTNHIDHIDHVGHEHLSLK